MTPFWRGVLSVFDIFGVRGDEPEDPPPRDSRTDAEKLRDDWRKVLGDWRDENGPR